MNRESFQIFPHGTAGAGRNTIGAVSDARLLSGRQPETGLQVVEQI